MRILFKRVDKNISKIGVSYNSGLEVVYYFYNTSLSKNKYTYIKVLKHMRIYSLT